MPPPIFADLKLNYKLGYSLIQQVTLFKKMPYDICVKYGDLYTNVTF
jgi:hypothetical protein